MKRRSFVAGLSAAAAWPLVAHAQKLRRIGVLMGISENPYPKSLLAAFEARLRELGWTEGSNLQTDYRWAAVDPAKSQAFARELVALQPDVILAHQNSSVEALLQETHKIPIVFVTVGDPIGNGFVGSYPHPGGNVTGFVVYEPAMAGKWLEILKDIVPGLSNAGVAYNPKVALSDFDLYLNALRAAGKRRQVEINVAQYDGETELERVINEFASQPGGGLVLVPDNFLTNRANLVVSLAAKYRLPGVYPLPSAVVWYRTALTRLTRSRRLRPMSMPFCVARNLRTCRFNFRPNLSW